MTPRRDFKYLVSPTTRVPSPPRIQRNNHSQVPQIVSTMVFLLKGSEVFTWQSLLIRPINIVKDLWNFDTSVYTFISKISKIPRLCFYLLNSFYIYIGISSNNRGKFLNKTSGFSYFLDDIYHLVISPRSVLLSLLWLIKSCVSKFTPFNWFILFFPLDSITSLTLTSPSVVDRSRLLVSFLQPQWS